MPSLVLRGPSASQLTCAHFEVWGDDIFPNSFMFQHHLVIYKSSVTTLSEILSSLKS